LSRIQLMKSADKKLRVSRQISLMNRKSASRSIAVLPELPQKVKIMPYDKTLISSLKKSKKFQESLDAFEDQSGKNYYYAQGDKHIIMEK